MIQTILFDFDGTLFDTGEGILRSVQYALEGFGIHETDTARLRKFVGPPLFDSFTELYGMQPAQAQAATERFSSTKTEYTYKILDSEKTLKIYPTATVSWSSITVNGNALDADGSVTVTVSGETTG